MDRDPDRYWVHDPDKFVAIDNIYYCPLVTWKKKTNSKVMNYTTSVNMLVGYSLFQCFFGIKCHAARDRDTGLGFNALLLWVIPGDL